MMDILIDSREKGRRERASTYYTNKGHKVNVETLDVGDYLFNDRVVFEYKQMSDFMSSILNESLFNEAANQSLKYDFHYVIIVGDVRQYLKESWFYVNNKWRNNYPKYLATNLSRYYGALRRLRTFTCPIECLNEENAFKEMLLQSIKCLDGKSKQYSNITRRVEAQDAVDVLLTSVKNISTKKATRIREHYTLNNIYDLLDLTEENFTEVEGIGKSTSNTLYNFLHKDVKGVSNEDY